MHKQPPARLAVSRVQRVFLRHSPLHSCSLISPSRQSCRHLACLDSSPSNNSSNSNSPASREVSLEDLEPPRTPHPRPAARSLVPQINQQRTRGDSLGPRTRTRKLETRGEGSLGRRRSNPQVGSSGARAQTSRVAGCLGARNKRVRIRGKVVVSSVLRYQAKQVSAYSLCRCWASNGIVSNYVVGIRMSTSLTYMLRVIQPVLPSKNLI